MYDERRVLGTGGRKNEQASKQAEVCTDTPCLARCKPHFTPVLVFTVAAAAAAAKITLSTCSSATATNRVTGNGTWQAGRQAGRSATNQPASQPASLEEEQALALCSKAIRKQKDKWALSSASVAIFFNCGRSCSRRQEDSWFSDRCKVAFCNLALAPN